MRKITWFIVLCVSVFSFMTAQAVTLNFENMKGGGLNDSLKARGVTLQSVERLTIAGELNGADIRLIRYMGGSNEMGDSIVGYNLSHLNLRKAAIVEGGPFYLKDNKGTEYSTEKDVFGAFFFAFCTNLLEVDFPESVTSVQKGGFYGCSNLKEVLFADEVKFSSLGSEMFYNCVDLGLNTKGVVLPKGITSFDYRTFISCVSMENISLPDGLETIGEAAFYNCLKLQKIELPSTVTQIGLGAFTGCFELKHINFPKSLTTIGDYAFQNCRELTDTIRINKNVSLGEMVFFNCQAVPAYVLEEGNKTCSSENGVLFNADKTELLNYPGGNRTIAEYTVPSSVKKIGYGAFYGGGGLDVGLRKLTVPSTVEEIEDKEWIAFNMGIKEIVFKPGSPLKAIGGFQFALHLEKVQLPSALDSIRPGAFEWAGSLREITIPESVTDIGSGAFLHCPLTNLHFSKNLKSIGVRAFFDCKQLSTLTIAEDNPVLMAENNVVYSRDKKTLHLFPAGLKDERFAIPSGVEMLGEGAFATNSHLKHLVVPESVTSLQTATFVNCINMETLILPDKLEEVPAGMCYGCTSMTSMNIPSNLKVIGDYAFFLGVTLDGDSLHSEWGYDQSKTTDWLRSETPTLGSKVTLPACLEEIGARAFNYCSFDTLVVGNKEPLGLRVHDNFGVFDPKCQASALLMVPMGSLSAYQSADQWSDFSKIEEQNPVGVDQVEQLHRAITSVKGGVRLIADKSYLLTIYQISGATVKQQYVIEGELVVPLSKGAYVVQLGNYKKKIVVE